MNKNESIYYSLPSIDDRKCPICGSYEGDRFECPECGHGEHADDESIESRRVKPQFLIEDVDDEYQEQLELMWYKQEMADKRQEDINNASDIKFKK